MNGKFAFSLFCFLISLLIGIDVQVAQASALSPQQLGQAAWDVVPLPPPTATADTNPDMAAALDEPFIIPIGQWATFSDTPEALGIQLSGLVSDNRCPAQVDCAVAGQVEFILIVRTGKVINQERFQIGTYTNNDQNKIRFAGYEIELTGVEPPAPPPNQKLQPSEYRATLVVRADAMATGTPEATPAPTTTPISQNHNGDEQDVAFNQPFTLLIGETASVRDADFHLTLRSLSDDSGCVSTRDCSLILADGTLVLEQGDDREVLTFSTSFTSDGAFSYEFAGYTIQLTHVEQAANGDQVATFVIEHGATTVDVPSPQRIERCPSFSRFDAAAILQEDVEPEGVANVVFGPVAADLEEVRGLCGYIGTTYTTDQQRDEQIAHLASALAADHAVAAMLLEGDDVLQMRQLAAIVSAANPDADPDDLVKLQTQLAAGDTEGVIDYLTNTAEEVSTFTVNNVEGIGDEAVWLWQDLAQGHLAMFVSRYDQTFSVVVALVGEEVDELTVLDYAVIVVRRFGEAPRPEISDLSPPEDLPVAGCELLSTEDAGAIMGEPVHAPVVVEEGAAWGICLYVPRSEPAVTAAEATQRGPEYGVFTQVIAQEDVVDQITSLVDDILLDNPDASDATLALLEATLQAGNTTAALQLLPQLVEDVDNWVIEDASEVGEGAIWIWYDDSELIYSAVMVPDPTGTIHTIIVSFYDAPNQDDVRAAMLGAAMDWGK